MRLCARPLRSAGEASPLVPEPTSSVLLLPTLLPLLGVPRSSAAAMGLPRVAPDVWCASRAPPTAAVWRPGTLASSGASHLGGGRVGWVLERGSRAQCKGVCHGTRVLAERQCAPASVLPGLLAALLQVWRGDLQAPAASRPVPKATLPALVSTPLPRGARALRCSQTARRACTALPARCRLKGAAGGP